MTKRFQKKIEHFICDHCGAKVVGTGYTNHCPNCLWSKHVDVFPGDRAANCRGLMIPIGLTIRKGKKIILHRCNTCGHEKFNEAAASDNAVALLKLSTQPFNLNK